MNLTKWAIFFLMIVWPINLMMSLDLDWQMEKEKVRLQVEERLASAMKDGVAAMAYYQSQAFDQAGQAGIEMEGSAVIDAFMTSYYYGFSAISQQQQRKMDQYLLAVVLLDVDGFYWHAISQVEKEGGGFYLGPVTSEKQVYRSVESDYVVYFSLSNQVSIVDRVSLDMFEGNYQTLEAWPYTREPSEFHQWRQEVVARCLEEALSQTIQHHTLYANQLGNYYDFHLPVGNGSLSQQAIESPGLMVICQGLGIGGEVMEDYLAYEQSRLGERQVIHGYEDPITLVKSYCERDCPQHASEQLIEVFSSRKAAAKAGYYPTDH